MQFKKNEKYKQQPLEFFTNKENSTISTIIPILYPHYYINIVIRVKHTINHHLLPTLSRIISQEKNRKVYKLNFIYIK